jgi:hypothetical protein
MKSTGRFAGLRQEAAIHHYVYLILCDCQDTRQRDSTAIYARIGTSRDPLTLFPSLVAGAPGDPGFLAVAEVPNRTTAFYVSSELRGSLIEWHAFGNWFSFRPGDRDVFNETCRRVFHRVSNSSWRVHWGKRFSGPQLAELMA